MSIGSILSKMNAIRTTTTVFEKTGTKVTKFITKDGKMAKLVQLGENQAKKCCNSMYPRPDEYLLIQNGKEKELFLFNEGRQIITGSQESFNLATNQGRRGIEYINDVSKASEYKIWA